MTWKREDKVRRVPKRVICQFCVIYLRKGAGLVGSSGDGRRQVFWCIANCGIVGFTTCNKSGSRARDEGLQVVVCNVD